MLPSVSLFCKELIFDEYLQYINHLINSAKTLFIYYFGRKYKMVFKFGICEFSVTRETDVKHIQ